MAAWTMVLGFFLVPSIAFAQPDPSPKADWNYVEKRLKEAKFRPDFIRELKAGYDEKDFLRVVELNTLLFLRKTDDHGIQVSPEAVNTVRSFMDSQKETLSLAEKEFGVSPSVIASLLWIESRHGTTLGKYHVASAFLHLVQAKRPSVVKYLKHASAKFATKVSSTQRKKIEERAAKKSAWALSELKALQKFQSRELALGLRGSFAGAFGIPQFLPSSYTHWARSPQKSRAPDLTQAQDAIYSVAYYLRDNGWRRKKSKTHAKALLRYNNSNDYVAAILKLAGQAEEAQLTLLKRRPADQ